MKILSELKKHTAFFNRYSLLFHLLLSVSIVFFVETASRRSAFSAAAFLWQDPLQFLYNSFLVFVSLLIVYCIRRRCFARISISCFWLLLGIVNGCVLSNRVTPFGFTDLKCVPDLLTMNAGYFSLPEIIVTVIGLSLLFAGIIFCLAKGPTYQGRLHPLYNCIICLVMVFVAIPMTTTAAQAAEILDSYYTNIAQGYKDNGFIYSFSSSVVDTGMSRTADYSEEAVDACLAECKEASVGDKQPNIICVLLESFCDPEEISFLETSEDPIPTFHELEENYSTGYLTVPVVGAGTANTEFEVLTGMSMKYFGTGEYPYKTILKQTDCESIASDLSSIGYATHAVHNNGGNFYSRTNAFSQMGFDTFTSKELMNIREYTPTGSWASDSILTSETLKTLDATPDQTDFTYVITVGTHGDYPTEEVISNPAVTVSGCDSQETTNQWTYYVNQLGKADEFINDLITALSERDEDTIVVLWGDHLPTMDLTDEDMKSGDIYKTKYVTWNNMGLEKEDADLYAYQLMASVTDSVGISQGTIFTWHQTYLENPASMAGIRLADSISSNAENEGSSYLDGLETLQYDLLYGDRYAYDGGDPYPATDLVMGIDQVKLDKITDTSPDVFLYGENFTKWSKVYVNGKAVETTYLNDKSLSVSAEDLKEGDEVTVCQTGSSETIFRSSNTYIYH